MPKKQFHHNLKTHGSGPNQKLSGAQIYHAVHQHLIIPVIFQLYCAVGLRLLHHRQFHTHFYCMQICLSHSADYTTVGVET